MKRTLKLSNGKTTEWDSEIESFEDLRKTLQRVDVEIIETPEESWSRRHSETGSCGSDYCRCSS